jgi:NADH dehydrogenase
MSALNADPNGPSKYLRSKGDAEQKVAASGLDWTIFRPSLIIGPEDRSLNTFAKIAKWMPVIWLPGASARFQPVWIGDVVRAIGASLDDTNTYGQRYPLCGPRVYTLRELFLFAARLVGRRPVIIKTPRLLAPLQAAVMQFLPGKPMTPDNLRSLSVDSVSDGTPVALLGGPPRPLEDVVPEYLAGHDKNWRYQVYRQRHAGSR